MTPTEQVFYWIEHTDLSLWIAGDSMLAFPAILTVHGLASVFWGPPSQVILHDIVGRERLPSAVRLSATSRQLGLIAGPAIGAALLLGLGPTTGIFINIAFYAPLVLFLWKAPYGPKFQKDRPPPRPVRGLADIVMTIDNIRGNRIIVSMILLSLVLVLLVPAVRRGAFTSFALGHRDAPAQGLPPACPGRTPRPDRRTPGPPAGQVGPAVPGWAGPLL